MSWICALLLYRRTQFEHLLRRKKYNKNLVYSSPATQLHTHTHGRQMNTNFGISFSVVCGDNLKMVELCLCVRLRRFLTTNMVKEGNKLIAFARSHIHPHALCAERIWTSKEEANIFVEWNEGSWIPFLLCRQFFEGKQFFRCLYVVSLRRHNFCRASAACARRFVFELYSYTKTTNNKSLDSSAYAYWAAYCCQSLNVWRSVSGIVFGFGTCHGCRFR